MMNSSNKNRSCIVEMVSVVNGKVTCNTKDLVVAFGKSHDNILKSVVRLIGDSGEFGQKNFIMSSYVSMQGKVLHCYDMTRDGFALLAMGFTGKKAIEWKIKYIEAFNAMESELLKREGEYHSRMAELNKAYKAMNDDKGKASLAGKALAAWKDEKVKHGVFIAKLESETQLLMSFE